MTSTIEIGHFPQSYPDELSLFNFAKDLKIHVIISMEIYNYNKIFWNQPLRSNLLLERHPMVFTLQPSEMLLFFLVKFSKVFILISSVDNDNQKQIYSKFYTIEQGDYRLSSLANYNNAPH